jgi:hypothetical protein
MSVFFRKGDKVKLLTIEELRKKCYSVKNDWGGLWVIEHHGSPQVHAYLQNEIYLLGSRGEVVASGYEPFVAVKVVGYGTINIPPVCLELDIPELDDKHIDDVVQVMIEQDEIDIAHILDGYENTVEDDVETQMTKTIQQMAKEHKNVEATPFVLEGTSEDIEPKDTSERLADLYREVVLVKVHLDEILNQSNELLKEQE